MNALDSIEEFHSKGVTKRALVEELVPGMIVNQNVETKREKLLLIVKGQELTETSILCIQSYGKEGNIEEPIAITQPVHLNPADKT